MKVFLVAPHLPDDRVTNITIQWARQLQQSLQPLTIIDLMSFLGEDAVRANVEPVLQDHLGDAGLFVFINHGARDKLFGADEQTLIDKNNITLLQNKFIYAIASSSASTLGHEALSAGAKGYIGFTHKLFLMSGATEIFEHCFLSGLRALLHHKTNALDAWKATKTAIDWNIDVLKNVKQRFPKRVDINKLITALRHNMDSMVCLGQHNWSIHDMTDQYLDFEVTVGRDGQTKAHSDEGERTATISTNIPNDVGLTLSLIEEKKTNEVLLKDFGKRLYEIIFPNNIHTHFVQTEAVARKENKKVRIRLNIEADNLARLPWEFMYREEGGHFFSINPETVLSRYLNLPLPQNRVRRREGSLHMLLIIAAPGDQGALDPNEWENIVTKALAEPINEKKITIDTVKEGTIENISDALLKRKPDIIQFVGHGIYRNGKGYLALVDSDTGGTHILDDERFANIFLGADDHLGLVSLATCESAKTDSPQGFLGIAPQIVQRGVPAVIAMQYKVLVSTAEIFLRTLYKAISARNPVDWAVQYARKQVSLKAGQSNREFATPVLYMRAKDGNIF